MQAADSITYTLLTISLPIPLCCSSPSLLRTRKSCPGYNTLRPSTKKISCKKLFKKSLPYVNGWIIPFHAFCPDPTALCMKHQFLHIRKFQSHVVCRCTPPPYRSCHPARSRRPDPWACCTRIPPVGLTIHDFVQIYYLSNSYILFYLTYLFYFVCNMYTGSRFMNVK